MVPMDSEKLSNREKQPGHDQTYRESEGNFIEVVQEHFDNEMYEVLEQPRELRDLFPRALSDDRVLGIQPEAVIINRETQRRIFFEVKKQGDRGNAEERACKHHTVAFYRTLHERFGYDYHPFVTVFCEALAINPRYTRKIPFYFEQDQYFLWEDYDPEILVNFLRDRCGDWIDP